MFLLYLFDVFCFIKENNYIILKRLAWNEKTGLF